MHLTEIHLSALKLFFLKFTQWFPKEEKIVNTLFRFHRFFFLKKSIFQDGSDGPFLQTHQPALRRLRQRMTHSRPAWNEVPSQIRFHTELGWPGLESQH